MKNFLNLTVTLFMLISLNGYSQSKQVLIKTNLGTIKVMLYDDTPHHRDEFISLVQSKHFDQTLFYRVINHFLIQGGSSDSKNAPQGKHIGYGSSEAEIASEIKPNHIHKRGALCAPRQPEDINIFKKSDASQFYISTGKVYTQGQLDTLELIHNRPIRNRLVKEYYLPRKKELEELKQSNPEKYNEQLAGIKTQIELGLFTAGKLEFTKQQREIYTTLGGNPTLDGSYTVFGEVVEGMDVVTKIERLKTDQYDRPRTDVVMKVTVL